jgi:hypothetical protein
MENLIPLQTQHNGRTGHSYVATATTGPSRAGLPEVWSDDGAILTLTERGHLVVSYQPGDSVRLKISARDKTRMGKLEQARK